MKMKAADPTSNTASVSNELVKIDDLEITPLSDEELDSIAGGYTDDNTTVASCACCAAGATNHITPKID